MYCDNGNNNESSEQCDQIVQFIGLWATFHSLWHQLICPNLLHSQAIFVKVSKSIIFLVKSFLGNFYRHLAIFTGHTGCNPLFYSAIEYLPKQQKLFYLCCGNAVDHCILQQIVECVNGPQALSSQRQLFRNEIFRLYRSFLS